MLGDESSRIELVYNPEFLRESSAVKDYFAPPKIVIGTRTGDPCPTLDKINDAFDLMHAGKSIRSVVLY